jgi:AcrR family transcriptional regulator
VAGLSRVRIVAAARDLVEREGLDRLSLRKLAASLGVTAPALYDHVASRDEVLRAVAEEGYHELARAYRCELPTAIERVRERALTYVRFAEEHPELFRLMFMYRPGAVAIEVDNELGAATEVFEAGLGDIGRAVEDGDLVARPPVQLGLILWVAMHGVATVSIIAPPLGASVADDVVDAMLAGLRPDATGGS